MFENLMTNAAGEHMRRAVLFCEARHGVIANNIANVTTPGFRAKDLSVEAFQESLRRAQLNRDFKVIDSPDAAQVREDGNNVSIEAEMSKLSSNAMMHRTLLSLLNHQSRLLQSALEGRG